MIISFGDQATEGVFNGVRSKYSRKIPASIMSVALRKLDMLNAAHCPDDLKIPPGNKFEHLKGNLSGFYSIRINDQYRIIFKMVDSNVHGVKIVDYH
jgi:proteic killer suppression protein